MNQLKIKQLAGRLCNGFEGGHGSLWHGVIDGVALCGSKPGRKSAGWVPFGDVGKEITCHRCLKKLKEVGDEA